MLNEKTKSSKSGRGRPIGSKSKNKIIIERLKK